MRESSGRTVLPVTIVIPQYRESDLTRRCVQSIRRRESASVPVVIIDDGSAGDGVFGLFAEESRHVVIHSQPHRGVTAAWNAGLKRAKTPYVVFLNNDVIVHGPFVQSLLAPLQTGTAGMTGAAMRRERQLPAEVLSQLPTRDCLQGWCFAAATERLRTLGGFDESLRLYWSDTDLQLRFVLHFNETFPQPLCAVPGLPLKHEGHQTTRFLRNRRELWRRDRAVFVRKWAGTETRLIRNVGFLRRTESSR